MAWCNGMDNWAPIESIPELQNLLDQARKCDTRFYIVRK